MEFWERHDAHHVQTNLCPYNQLIIMLMVRFYYYAQIGIMICLWAILLLCKHGTNVMHTDRIYNSAHTLLLRFACKNYCTLNPNVLHQSTFWHSIKMYFWFRYTTWLRYILTHHYTVSPSQKNKLPYKR